MFLKNFASSKSRWIHSARLLRMRSYSLVFARTLSSDEESKKEKERERVHCADSTRRTLLHEATPNSVEQLLTKPTQTEGGMIRRSVGVRSEAELHGQTDEREGWVNEKQMTTSPGWLGLDLIGLVARGEREAGSVAFCVLMLGT